MAYLYENKTLDKSSLARISAEIEINYLKEPIGKQDHYAAYGGLNILHLIKTTQLMLNQ